MRICSYWRIRRLFEQDSGSYGNLCLCLIPVSDFRSFRRPAGHCCSVYDLARIDIRLRKHIGGRTGNFLAGHKSFEFSVPLQILKFVIICKCHLRKCSVSRIFYLKSI